jgi:hypothetical protein
LIHFLIRKPMRFHHSKDLIIKIWMLIS